MSTKPVPALVILSILALGVNSQSPVGGRKHKPTSNTALRLHPSSYADNEPQQIHLATVSDDVTRTVSWTTLIDTPESVVQFGFTPSSLNYAEVGRSFAFVDGNITHRTIYIHNAKFGDELTPSTLYYYRVGDPSLDVWSDVYNFTTFDADYPLMDFLVYGDFGVVNDQSETSLLAEVLRHTPQQMVIHVGDFGYDLHWFDGQRGDVFMNQIQPIAAYLPYAVTNGNHELAYNFSHYTNRFSLVSDTSNTGQNWWYSFDISYIHFVSFMTELYFVQPWGNSAIIAQYEWVKQDLAKVDRSKTPWVVVFGHRPAYCSNVDDLPDCSEDTATLRDGTIINGVNYGIDQLLYEGGVDLYLTAHEHSYERLWPTYNSQVDPTQHDPNVYTDAQYPTHIVTGAAGCQEYLDYFSNVSWAQWSCVRSSTYGYGHLRIANATHLHWTQLEAQSSSSGSDQTVIDDLWLVKTNAKTVSTPTERRRNPDAVPDPVFTPIRENPVTSRRVNPTDLNGGDYCDRYCIGVCQQYHPLREVCIPKCRCSANVDVRDLEAVRRFGEACTVEVTVEKSVRH